jgi:hypothetical protein
MEKAGKMKWKETVKANWARARSSASHPENICTSLGAGRGVPYRDMSI